MDKDFDTDLESAVADVLQCAADGKGDHILAARFLSRFVPKTIAWLHLDLAAGIAAWRASRTSPPRSQDSACVTPSICCAAAGRPRRREPMNTPDDSAARRLACAFARRRRARIRCEVHGRTIRPRHRDAQSQAADHHDRAGAAYRGRILAALPAHSRFEPLMTLYLTDTTRPRRSTAHRIAGSSTASSSTRQARPLIRTPASRISAGRSGACAHGGARHAAAGARRNGAGGCRCLRPRNVLHRCACSHR